MFGHLWVVELTYIKIFAFKFTLEGVCSLILLPLFATGVVDTGGKFAAGVVDTGSNLPPVSLTPVANLPPVSTTLAKMVEKFATGVADTGGKFATGVVDTGGNFAAGVVDTWHRWHRWCTLTRQYLREFSKKFETVLMEYSGAGGELIYGKNQIKKSRDTVPLNPLPSSLSGAAAYF